MQAAANFSLLKFLLQTLYVPVEVFDFPQLEANKRKATFGLLIALFFIKNIRENVDEEMEFEVGITQSVCDFLQSAEIVQIAAQDFSKSQAQSKEPESDEGEVMNELNQVSGLRASELK